ncbi:MAG: flagellar basal body rod protein FlgB [Chloroflexi bacterium]|nr:flagellar basal body rod protein FlgB [Dehalococcoidia bacterium]MCO5201552.1 flagellar basal body rod protein FlgB [Chloroflexota bacterium]MCZ7576750.1 flagellar basal body rod protein FlgB [Dehalococcoidia bacterium]NJD64077.1 flagellar basal body rod protein FlgB [Chloroflexota bacterium]PWB42166.1 MAG: flagellar basal body rod protein FlgB [Dehalococcoidia bacterium]
MNPIGDRGIETLTGWLRGLSRRQGAISNNIANIDTPGYARQDVNFETELQRQFGAGSSAMAATDPRHFTAGSNLRGQVGIDPQQLLTSSRLDGNSVDIDQEMVLLAETQMRYQAASRALSTKLNNIRTVIQG